MAHNESTQKLLSSQAFELFCQCHAREVLALATFESIVLSTYQING